jgi:RNA polymerase sigma-70 factor (ECF subfamily)
MDEESMGPTDKECIEGCLSGHPEQYRVLVERYEAGLVAYVTGRMKDRASSEEMAQETLVRAYFSLSKLKDPDAFFVWMLRIADHVIQENRRARDRRAKLNTAVRQRGQQMDTAAPKHEVDYSLREAIAGLPEGYREIVLLRHYGELSCAEVSQRLGKPLGTVTKMLSRAYAMLREVLQDQANGRQTEGAKVR